MDKKKERNSILLICISCIILLGCYCIVKVNDESDVLSSSSTEYDLDELEEYFEGCNALVPDYFGGGSDKILYLKDVNQKFPVEDIRPWGYSVYKVTGGGCYYVFWSNRHIYEDRMVTDDTAVMFTTYITPEPKDVALFESLEPGVSTARDVEVIDPYVEMLFTRSSGVFSCSFLDSENILEIEYYFQPEELKHYREMIVKEINVYPRVERMSCFYDFILPEDLP